MSTLKVGFPRRKLGTSLRIGVSKNDLREGTDLELEMLLQKLALEKSATRGDGGNEPRVVEFGDPGLLLALVVVLDDSRDFALDVFEGVEWDV